VDGTGESRHDRFDERSRVWIPRPPRGDARSEDDLDMRARLRAFLLAAPYSFYAYSLNPDSARCMNVRGEDFGGDIRRGGRVIDKERPDALSAYARVIDCLIARVSAVEDSMRAAGMHVRETDQDALEEWIEARARRSTEAGDPRR
jgi:hypothetical protein